MPKSPEEIEKELSDRALAVQENTVNPDEPTMRGWMTVYLEEIVALRIAAEEAKEASRN